ncbi:MAG: hypothetical protein JW751_00765 [Polyangiaceae bacterium]|nr:hypothetical protein [Polyangiaceae bacterium]
MKPRFLERRALCAVVICAWSLLLAHCTRKVGGVSASHEAASVAAAPRATGQLAAKPVAGAASRDRELAPGVVIGEPAAFENLTVFPVLACAQADAGVFNTLPAAIAAGVADVRELGKPEGSPDPVGEGRARRSRRGEVVPDDGPRVGTLAVENRGEVAIYVLAGTVVKGGNQDRQIAQDFVVPPGETVPVDAFCVERGRWQEERGGVATQGRFAALEQLANTNVRAAAQFKQDQGAVWSQVAEVNRANRKEAGTGTLMATLDAPDVAAQRTALAGAVKEYLARGKAPEDLVGVAYAVDGRIKGVRWFANHSLFSLFEETLINTAAVDAVTSPGRPAGDATPARRQLRGCAVRGRGRPGSSRGTGAARGHLGRERDRLRGVRHGVSREDQPPAPQRRRDRAQQGLCGEVERVPGWVRDPGLDPANRDRIRIPNRSASRGARARERIRFGDRRSARRFKVGRSDRGRSATCRTPRVRGS